MTFTDTSLGKTGAKRQSWRTDNPRALLEQIARKNPDADYDELHALWWAKARMSAPMLEVVGEFWFHLNHKALNRSGKPASETTSAERVRAKTEREERVVALETKVTAKIEEIAKEKATIMLSTMKMPNGKEFQDCTGAYMDEQMIPWMSRVAQIIGKRGTTRKAGLTEARLKKLHDQP